MGYTLAVIGGGNMARSIISGAVEGKILNVNEVVVADPDPFSRGFFDQLGINTVADAGQLPESESDGPLHLDVGRTTRLQNIN